MSQCLMPMPTFVHVELAEENLLGGLGALAQCLAAEAVLERRER